jgi:uncharacterized membrane protein YfcA
MIADLLLFVAAFGAGIMNAVAGGGSFLTFPALVFTAVPSIIANASSTVATFPGSLVSAWAYRKDFKPFDGVGMRGILAVSLAGSILGALLLLWTPQRTFDAAIPWLLGAATLLFAVGRHVTPWLKRVIRIGPTALLSVQFVIAIYGGYFGGAIGILMLAMFGLYGLDDIHRMNAMKTLLAGTLNAAAVVCFIIAGKVWWTQTAIMFAGAILGGLAGPIVAKRMKQSHLRLVIIAIGVGMTVAFAIRS